MIWVWGNDQETLLFWWSHSLTKFSDCELRGALGLFSFSIRGLYFLVGGMYGWIPMCLAPDITIAIGHK